MALLLRNMETPPSLEILRKRQSSYIIQTSMNYCLRRSDFISEFTNLIMRIIVLYHMEAKNLEFHREEDENITRDNLLENFIKIRDNYNIRRPYFNDITDLENKVIYINMKILKTHIK
jgi:hypothetical protein